MMEDKLRQAILKPLVRRRRNTIDEEAILTAYKRIDSRALGIDLIGQLRDVINSLGKDKTKKKYGDPYEAKKQVELTRALYLSRKITISEYVYFAAYYVENVFDHRMTDGAFKIKFGDISKAMRKIENAYGLGPDEFWKKCDAPKEYLKLDAEWGKIYDKLFIDTLKEFTLNDLSNLISQNPKEFDRLRERGRRSVAHKNEIELIVRDIIVRYEKDVKRAADANAYSAAVVCLGAGLEGLLLLRCYRSKFKSIRIAKKLPRRMRPRYSDDLTTWTFNNLIEVCYTAGWLPSISTDYATYNSAGLAHILRNMRNYIHPGRYAKDKPWSEISERDFKDAHAIYTLILSKLAGIGPRKLNSLANQ